MLLAASLAVAAPAQSEVAAPGDTGLRAKALGVLRDADKMPWVGARVTLVSYPAPEVPSAGEVDRLVVTTDQRGRFRADVLRNRRYSVWGGQGRRVTEVAEGLVAGVPVLLSEAPTVEAKPCRVNGLEAWKQQGPVRVQVLFGTQNLHLVELALDEQGGFLLPAVAGTECTIEVVDATGLPRMIKELALPLDPELELVQIELPKPELEHLAVRDIQTGKGLANVSIMAMHRGALTPIGKTDAVGLAQVHLPFRTGRMQLFAVLAGYSAAPVQHGDAKQVKSGDWKALKAGIEVGWHTNLNKGLQFKGRILLGPGVPAANMSLILRGQGMHFARINGRNVQIYRRVVRTDKDGRFELTGCLPEDYWRTEIFAVFSPRHIVQLPAAWRRQITYRVDDFLPLAKGKPGAIDDLGDIEMHEMCPVLVSVFDYRWQPAQFAELNLSSGKPAQGTQLVLGSAIADRSGRLLILAKPGDENSIVVRYRGAIAVFRLLIQSIKTEFSPAKLRIELPKTLTISGHVVDAADEPIAGVSLRCNPKSRTRLGGLRVGADLDEEHPPGRNSACLRELDKRTADKLRSTAFGSRKAIETDSEGAFRFEVPAFPMQYQLFGFHDGQQLRLDVSVSDESIHDLKFELK